MATLCEQGLGGAITEFGSNLSMGEKQLLCLERVLLQRARYWGYRKHRGVGHSGVYDVCLSCVLAKNCCQGLKCTNATMCAVVDAVSSVYVCDESTASIDEASNGIVHDALLALPSTVLFVCHRLEVRE